MSNNKMNRVRIELVDNKGNGEKQLTYLSTGVWNNTTGNHVLAILEQTWKPAAGDSINIYINDKQVDGLDC